jgi:hypothetical protein
MMSETEQRVMDKQKSFKARGCCHPDPRKVDYSDQCKEDYLINNNMFSSARLILFYPAKDVQWMNDKGQH